MIGSYKVPMKLFEGVDAEVNLLVKSDGNIMTEEMAEITEGKVEPEPKSSEESSSEESSSEEKNNPDTENNLDSAPETVPSEEE